MVSTSIEVSHIFSVSPLVSPFRFQAHDLGARLLQDCDRHHHFPSKLSIATSISDCDALLVQDIKQTQERPCLTPVNILPPAQCFDAVGTLEAAVFAVGRGSKSDPTMRNMGPLLRESFHLVSVLITLVSQVP